MHSSKGQSLWRTLHPGLHATTSQTVLGPLTPSQWCLWIAGTSMPPESHSAPGSVALQLAGQTLRRLPLASAPQRLPSWTRHKESSCRLFAQRLVQEYCSCIARDVLRVLYSRPEKAFLLGAFVSGLNLWYDVPDHKFADMPAALQCRYLILYN